MEFTSTLTLTCCNFKVRFNLFCIYALPRAQYNFVYIKKSL
uniref:Uncharacterized protein n=1 Tax=Human betaherpesvirus 6 TaxID=10368 RepID=A0A5P9VID1_9BETA|nr:hypothetical protein [Human betaherpesvirus 6]QFV49807.1 hypothetical protein [Human betaherpesvirus 6]QFX16124.1 hypothetical protein [Human betaherpesvirus 6]QFX43718.1 hypothetical protein [Human betaherpesvirus 6]QFX53689.1 hypothetical protein [Human betaherpesvirus 6]